MLDSLSAIGVAKRMQQIATVSANSITHFSAVHERLFGFPRRMHLLTHLECQLLVRLCKSSSQLLLAANVLLAANGCHDVF
ncbi:hypothetical protein RMSM_00776 [Rhodopirellula maiorica SM1]|uniref:Uncharacterized protein n=1 Tax=Rhodopirellula maiorica SM1 TaxID=1265738 RepID=M5RSP9_9BACT|nr:hypothetical protein RMSM_00776 [Rhodopirellula maiorica SM1]